ncbi:hypothetical protein Moror_2352 [Moniliophthora roreri MCA 2997]|uniref:Uncharacterized protein n=1 Tax=Moniliophthora roreri (strain MCA 2997) TaxID=1381753 RepID=V2X092_MONRO|nr:hypothetical protein Moror_2352 [Moniliophthora roreri MCA 2997]
MLSLQDISISDDPDFELESYALISRDDSWAAMQFTHFEWSFGLGYRGIPLNSEYNVVKVSKDLIPCLQKQTLQFAPTKDVIQHACDMLAYNHTMKVGERRKFEEFGEGPWEYVLFPGRFDHKTLKPEYLPPLYQRSSNGQMSLLTLNAHSYDTLPRMSLMVHPTIAILLLKLYQPDALHSPQSLKENVIFPIIRIVGKWPHWSHNRFKPLPTSKRKRRRSEASNGISCKCTLCVYDSSSDEEEEDSGTNASDFDSSDSGENVGNVDLDVAAWAQKVVLLPASSGYDYSDGISDDELLRTYAQESALAPGQVKKALKEENQKRSVLAAPTLKEVRCCLSKKRSRHG